MNRRALMSLLGGAAAAWPLTARSQQPGKLPTIGFLGGPTPSAAGQWVVVFAQRLRELGWIEFVRLKVDVIVTAGPPVFAAKQATSVVPIVFATMADPLDTGLVASLSKPGGKITGLSLTAPELGSKRLELMREVIPNLRRL